MASQMFCILFVDPVKMNEEMDEETSSFPTSEGNGYALMFSSVPWKESSCIALKQAFTACGLEIIGSGQTAPSTETKFEAFEIRIENRIDTRWDVYSRPCNHSSMLRLFLRFPHFRISEWRWVFDFNNAIIDLENVRSAEKLLAIRPDIPFRDGEGGSLLHFAVSRGQRFLFERLLDLGANVELRNNNGDTPLFLAVRNTKVLSRKFSQHHLFTKMLLSNGADILKKKSGGLTLLHEAVEVGHLSVVKLLLKSGASALVNVSDDNGKTPLHVAVAGGASHTSIVLALLQHGANANAPNGGGIPPLLLLNGSAAMLKILVEHGASVDFQTGDNRTVLLLAVQQGRREAIEFILSLGPDPNLVGNREALYVALQKCGGTRAYYATLVERMLQQGFTIDPTDCVNRPEVLAGAVDKGRIEDVRNLLDNGAAVNKVTNFYALMNMTPLLIAIRTDNADMVRLLLNYGADVNFVRPSEKPSGHLAKTPLVTAIDYATLKVFELLFEAGPLDRANPRLLLYTVESNRPDIVEFLLQKGFDLRAKSRDGRTFVSVALCRGHTDVIEVLTKYGAKCAYSDLPHYMLPQSHKQMMHTGPLNEAVFEKFLYLCPPKLTTCDENTLLKVFKDDVYLQSPKCHGQILASHMIKMEILNPEVKFTALIPPMAMIKIDAEFASRCGKDIDGFKESCKLEVESMNVKIPQTHVTYYDILTQNEFRVARYTRNSNIVEAMTSESLDTRFPIYSGILIAKFKSGLWYNTLIEKAARVLSFLTRNSSPFIIPDVIIEMILHLLSHQDLVILQRCLPVQASCEKKLIET